MCYRVECRSCGRYTWGGCGRHLTTLYSSIDQGMHCTCRSWPGVVMPSQRTTTTTPSPSPTHQPSQSITSSQVHDNFQNWGHIGRTMVLPWAMGILKIKEAVLDSNLQQFFWGYTTCRETEIDVVGILPSFAILSRERERETVGDAALLRFCTTGLPSDIVIEVDDMDFHLHKSPLMSKSRKLHHLITEHEANHSSEADKHCHLAFADFPGGSDTFELAAKFCFGAKIELSSSNVAPLRCAGEFLEMTEQHSEQNLITKTETFVSHSVLNSVKDSIIALKTCERLMPLAETLGITRRCVDSIVSVSDSASILRRNVEDDDFWLEELTLLGLPMFKQLILGMKRCELKPEIIETCILQYAKKHIPGLSRKAPSCSEAEQKELAVAGEEESDVCRAGKVAVRENQVLRLDMDSMRTRVNELERECSRLKRAIEKMGPRGGGPWRASLALGRKFGCKFKTQVCDSHEPATVVETREGTSLRRPHRE
ncbi:hypothetical protein VNO78_08244 [Psophocarpus tetragonolobus]|uniref:BTB domain-containing protein n=1 Tax=Psophocarpus tetragonolobus TaxID=3891 RepID=A0AAN9XSP8_PSOTE